MKYAKIDNRYEVTVASWEEGKAASKIEELACDYETIEFFANGRRLVNDMTIESKLGKGIPRKGGAADKLATLFSTAGGPKHVDVHRREVLVKLFDSGVAVTITIHLP